MTFAAIDFETATGYHNSACAVGIVIVEGGIITEEFYSLIQPPNNEYWYRNTMVHGIKPEDTADAFTFERVYPEIKKRLTGRVTVAHNESFDRNVLIKSMSDCGLHYEELGLPDRWECTVRIYRAKGYPKANLKYCSDRHGITLNHHEALSDARACAQLFLLHNNQLRINL